MRIDFNRLCKLAGVATGSPRSGLIREGKDHDSEKSASEMAEMYEQETDEGSYGMHEEEDADEGRHMYEEEDADEGHCISEKDDDDQDEMVEVDMAELMSEIRRAKNIMAVNEQRKINIARRKRRLQENHLKRVIQKEVENVLSEIEDRDSSWVYGNRQPRYSKKGYTNHGRTLPGIGFNKKW